MSRHDEKIRSFIALPCTDEIREKLKYLQWEAKDAGLDAKWVAPQNIHCTIKFLGSVAMKGLKKVENIVSEICAGADNFSLTVSGLGVFPTTSRARVMWAGSADGAAALNELQRQIDDETKKIGFHGDERGFTPHFTLGRFKKIPDSAVLKEFINKHEKDIYGHMKIEKLLLVKSELFPEGPKYTVLAEFPLRG